MTPRCHQRCSSATDRSMVSGVKRPALRSRSARFAALALACASVLLASLPSAAASAAVPAWVPEPSDTWQYQLQGTINRSVKADVFDVDAFDVPKATVAALHAMGG